MKAKLINPAFLNLFIPISIALHFIYPIKIIVYSPLKYLGLVVILGGLMLNQAATKRLRGNQTPVEFDQAPLRLVTDGPFRFSRNPIYLGGVLVLLGIASLFGSLVTFVFPVLLFLILDLIYIPVEEQEMEAVFGTEYVEYKQTVRKWA
jgi:protein-S-isoprenylcysteine O-methyltransferase Ste14